MATVKPNVNKAWAQTGTVVVPDDARILQGWQIEKPPYETMNFVENRQDDFNKHINELGIAEWDAITIYGISAITMGSDGALYRSLQDPNQNKDPISFPLFWVQMFENPGVVSFSAYQTGPSQLLLNASEAKLRFNNLIFNLNGDYDVATYRFTPKVAGKYITECRLIVDAPVTISYDCQLEIRKNGTQVIDHEVWFVNSAISAYPKASGLINMNGTTDYLEAYGIVRNPGGAVLNQSFSFFCATKVN